MSKRTKSEPFGRGGMVQLGKDLEREHVYRKYDEKHLKPTRQENDRLREFVEEQVRKARVVAGPENLRRCVVTLGSLQDAINGK